MLKAIFFDMDGTIVDTEKDGHRVAFNKAFQQTGLNAEWSIPEYSQLLQVAGGKERMKFYFRGKGKKYLSRDVMTEEFIQQLHQLKTKIFISMIESGELPLRPGIKRIMKEANEEGIKIGICTTSNEKAAQAIADTLLKDIDMSFILAGDIVRNKKPAPEIYNLALQEAGVTNTEAIVIEDSGNGVIAAKRARLKVIATINEYTKDEELSQADLVLTCLGDEQEDTGLIVGNIKFSNKRISLNDIIEWF